MLPHSQNNVTLFPVTAAYTTLTRICNAFIYIFTMNFIQDQFGLLYLSPRTQKLVPIPLKSVSITASVVHAVAQVEITQIYANFEDTPIEAVYIFPVDCNGAVTHFRADLDGKSIQVCKYLEIYQNYADYATLKNNVSLLKSLMHSEFYIN